MASIERSLWRPLCLHSAITATLEPPWRWFCLHSAFFARPVVPLQQLWSFKEGTRVVLQQLHRNRTFWVPATTERPNHFYGRTRVARRSQPCVKGPLTTVFAFCLIVLSYERFDVIVVCLLYFRGTWSSLTLVIHRVTHFNDFLTHNSMVFIKGST